MLRFVLRFLAFLTLLLAAVQGLNRLAPAEIHTEVYQRKAAVLRESGPFDTLFFGSSRTYRHIISAQFDRRFGGRSYNLGFPAATGLELLYLGRRLLQEDLTGVQRLVWELSPIVFPGGGNRETERFRYHMDSTSLRIGLSGVLTSRLSAGVKLRRSGGYCRAALERLFGVGLLWDQLKYLAGAGEQQAGICDRRWAGYCPFEAQLQQGGASALVLKARRREFLRRGRNLQAGTRRVKRIFWSTSAEEASRAYLAELQRLSGKFQRRGIRLFLLLPPLLTPRQYAELLPLFRRLPAGRRINLANPARYPQFYQVEFLFDRAHLNGAGARRLTNALADQIRVLER